MCAVHAINNMLQGPVVNEVQLAEIGRDCDAAERRAMADGGVDTPEYVAFIRGGSNNVNAPPIVTSLRRCAAHLCCDHFATPRQASNVCNMSFG
eukprot:SAG31_NODE_532_length_14374_cov_30.565254_5_plen_94_part_00